MEVTAEEREFPVAMDACTTDDEDAAAGNTESCTRAPDCKSRDTPGADGSVTPSQPIEARGTARVFAAAVMMVLCMASVNAPEEPKNKNDTRSTVLPLDGVTSAVLDGVRVFDGVGEAVSVVVDERETVGELDGVRVGEVVGDAVMDGVEVCEGVGDHDEM